jgi:hypothetical protein
MWAYTAGNCTFKPLRCCVPIPRLRFVSPLGPTPPFPIGKQQSETIFRIGWERHCSGFLRPSEIYESLEISRSSVRTHVGSRPNGRLEELWRSALRRVRKASFNHLCCPLAAACFGREPTAASNQVVACAALVGLMLWFMRKKFVGSYLFFKATRRS